MTNKSFTEFNEINEALKLFQSFFPFIIDVRGIKIHFDYGSYAHILDNRQALRRVNHIKQTLVNPDEIRQSIHKDKKFREIYLKKFYKNSQDDTGETFVVIVDKRINYKFWTCFLPFPDYLTKLKKGKVIWKP